MSRLHRITAGATVLAAICIAGGAAWSRYPLDLAVSAQVQTSQESTSAPGRLERSAAVADSASAVPRRLHGTRFTFPAEARGVVASALIAVRVVIDESGSVGEARLVRTRAEYAPGADQAATARAIGLITDDALGRIREWRYEPPAKPVTWTMTVFYNDGPPQATREADDPPAAEPADKALRVGGPIAPPRKLVNVAPEYPQAAEAAGITGLVIIELTIDTGGSVSDARVIRSAPEFDAAALEAVRQWKYQPTLLNGAPVPVIMTVTVNFALPE